MSVSPIEHSHGHNHADQQPSSLMCFICGVKNVAGLQIRFFCDGATACRAELIIDDRHQGFPGIAHGGIVGAILDETMGRAALSGNQDRLMFTGKLEVRFRRNVPLHTRLIVRGKLDKDRGRLATASGEMTLEDGTVLAEATSTLVAIPPEQLALMDRDLAGWKVYTE